MLMICSGFQLPVELEVNLNPLSPLHSLIILYPAAPIVVCLNNNNNEHEIFLSYVNDFIEGIQQPLPH